MPTASPTLRSTQSPAGTNRPAPTPTSINLQQRIAEKSAKRLAAAEARYVAALTASMNGDEAAVETLIGIAAVLCLSPEQIGRDRSILEEHRILNERVAAWTAADQKSLDAHDALIRAAHEDMSPAGDARRKGHYNNLVRARSPLQTKHDDAVRRRKELERMLQDPRARMLLALTTEADS